MRSGSGAGGVSTRAASFELGPGTPQARLDGAEGDAKLIGNGRDGSLVEIDAEEYATKPLLEPQQRRFERGDLFAP